MAPPFAQKPSRFSQMRADASRARTSKADISRDLDIARGKKEFFGGNPNVSDDRAFRRMQQADQLQSFKNQFTKPVQGSSNLLQMTADAPRSLAEESMRLANKFGPTPSEVKGDIGRGIGNIFNGIAERGTPLMQLAKDIGGGILNFFNPQPFTPTTGDSSTFDLNTTVNFRDGLDEAQLGIFNYYLNMGNSPEYARNAALFGIVPERMATGGIATLR